MRAIFGNGEIVTTQNSAFRFAWKSEWKSHYALKRYDESRYGFSRTADNAESNAWAAANMGRACGAQNCKIEIARLY